MKTAKINLYSLNELNEQAKENAVISAKLNGLAVHEKHTQDKRRSIKMYFLALHGASISPVMDYENTNHFILGLSKGLLIAQKGVES